ncbi:MAG: membrane protein insertase YidC [Ichthyobacteriaceae bacterium]|nr:membrane protein insertase YidC [Ichthyobacteriaceae bacterium]
MQQEKKFDANSLIGFVLMGAILMYFMYTNEPLPDEELNNTTQTEQVENSTVNVKNTTSNVVLDSSAAADQLKLKYGKFYYSASLPSANEETTTVIENNLLKLTIANKGGEIVEAQIKDFKTYDQKELKIIENGNAKFNLLFSTTNNRTFNSGDLFFEPSLTNNGDSQILSMKAKVSENQYIEYVYTLNNDYMLDFNIRTVGLENVLDASKTVAIDWNMEAKRTEKSFKNENMYTTLNYEYEDGKDDYLSAAGSDDATEKDVSWVAFKQQFFSMVLLTDNKFESVSFKSNTYEEFSDEENHIQGESTKDFAANIPLKVEGGNVNYSMNWYIGPNKFDILKGYDRNLDTLIPLGWGIFGWVNKFFVIPLFSFLEGMGLGYGAIILILTFIVKLILSPVTYKNFLSSAKMKVIRPEINELNEKMKDADSVKKQQATMELYKKAGVNPMAGCLPALLQMPILIALFRFFPSAIELRQQSFLWAEDLSSYDSIMELPFYIFGYGDHVSLFTILMAIALMAYTMMSGAGANQPQQPGMPNMKYMMYLMPVMMLFWFNSYASGLSYYYFLSNFISIIQIIIIKKYIMDEDKIHAIMQENRSKPQKAKSKWSQRMDDMMKQAQQQKQDQDKNKKNKKK